MGLTSILSNKYHRGGTLVEGAQWVGQSTMTSAHFGLCVWSGLWLLGVWFVIGLGLLGAVPNPDKTTTKCNNSFSWIFLLPAYVVWQEGNSFTLLVCLHLGGYPYPIMLCKITQSSTGQTPGGYPARSSWGGILPGSAGGPPGQVRMRGYPAGGTLPGYSPPARSGWGGGNQLQQQKEYSLHGGRYASCVHVGGLSCFTLNVPLTSLVFGAKWL